MRETPAFSSLPFALVVSMLGIVLVCFLVDLPPRSAAQSIGAIAVLIFAGGAIVHLWLEVVREKRDGKRK